VPHDRRTNRKVREAIVGFLSLGLQAGQTAPAIELLSMDKLALLTEILTQNPNDAFARYGLAMEHISRGNTEAGLREFDTLITQSPDYVPAYQMSAQTLAKIDRPADALARLHAGIAAANRTGNQHALAEMDALREELTAANNA